LVEQITNVLVGVGDVVVHQPAHLQGDRLLVSGGGISERRLRVTGPMSQTKARFSGVTSTRLVVNDHVNSLGRTPIETFCWSIVNSSSVLFIVGLTPFLVPPKANHDPSGSKIPLPGVVSVTVAVGVVPPVNAGVLTVVSGRLEPASWPWKVSTTAVPGSGPPVATTLPVPMVESASSAACTLAAVAVEAIAAVVTPLNESRKVPPTGVPVIVRVWTSFVGDPVRRTISPMLAGGACESGAA
jgi:hypothetical protein